MFCNQRLKLLILELCEIGILITKKVHQQSNLLRSSKQVIRISIPRLQATRFVSVPSQRVVIVYRIIDNPEQLWSEANLGNGSAEVSNRGLSLCYCQIYTSFG